METMQIIREIPESAARPLAELPQQLGLGPLVGVAAVNERNPNKTTPTGVIAAIGLGALSIGLGAGNLMRSGQMLLGLLGIVVGVALVIAADFTLAHFRRPGNEYVAVHEGGFVWAGTGSVDPRVIRFPSATVKFKERPNPRPAADEARQYQWATFQDGPQKVRIYAFRPDEQAVLATLLARVPNAAHPQANPQPPANPHAQA